MKKNSKKDKEGGAWLVPEVVKPKTGQYLKTAFVEFKAGEPVYYFTLHNPVERLK